MQRNYFIVVLAHPVLGRIRRLHVPHYVAHLAVALMVLAGIVGVGMVSSYARMLGKVSEFNEIRSAKAALQKRYDELRERVEERDAQLASLGNLASEVSIAFGIKRQMDDVDSRSAGAGVWDAAFDPVNQFDVLQAMRTAPRSNSTMLSMLSNTTPSIWPVRGRISSAFGNRLDPFHGKGAFHGGVDLSTRSGTAVVATADGTVSDAGWSGGYGKRVVVRHGSNGLTTVYAHLTELFAVPGQVVRRGEVIGRAGATGRATSSHLHYEVRYRGTPVNPYKYLNRDSGGRLGLGGDMTLTD